MALDPVAATAALVDAINALRVVEEPCSDALRSAWRDDGAIWTVNWAESLSRDIANAAAALEHAEAEGATDQGATEIENALWRVDAAFEKLHDVIALGLGVPALKLNPNKKGIRRFESDRRENRKKLRELAADHKAAGAILEIDERINNHRFLALRHQMTHSLAPILAWQSLIWFEVGEIDDKGGVVTYSSHHLTPAHELQTSIQPDQLFGRTIADGRDVIGLMISAMNKLADLFRTTGELPPPPALWRVRRTGELFFDRSEASRAARDAASPAAGRRQLNWNRHPRASRTPRGRSRVTRGSPLAQNVITPEVKQRVAELVGLGCTYEEAGKAKGISLRSVERILSDPVYRRIADDATRKRTSSGAQAAQVVRDLLGANKADGSPDMDARRRGAELYAKNPELLDSDVFEEDLLPGCAVFVRFPHAGYHGDGTPLPGKAAAELRAQHPKLAARMQARNTEVDEPQYITFSEDELAPVAP